MSESVEQPPLKMANPPKIDSGTPPASPQPPAPNAQVHLSPNQKAWRRFKRNRPAVISSLVFVGLLMVVIGWPVALGGGEFDRTERTCICENYDPNTLSDQSFAPPTQHIGSGRMRTGAICFRGFFMARRFRCWWARWARW